MTKLTDYASVLATYFAREESRAYTARDLAAEAHLPLPTVSKILKALARGGVLTSHRGLKGGYTLSRAAEEISLTDIIAAMEGPMTLTECGEGEDVGHCPHQSLCPVTANWQRINFVLRQALSTISLAAMTHPLPRELRFEGSRLPMASGLSGQMRSL
ncbi:MAG: SUF system Fe-S cluster assembly regulator [Thermoanaerobaculia bacterium]